MKISITSVWLCGVVALSGCGSGDETGSYRLVPVSGTVTRNGKPLEGARVEFVPDPNNKPMTPGGDTTGPEGNYKAMYRNRSGLAPGKYKAVVTVPTPAGAVVHEALKDDPYMAALARGEDPGAPAAARKGAGPEQQEWPVTVGEQGETLDFDVKGKAK